MTQMDDLIGVNGGSIDIYRKSEGALDEYRDPAPTWAKQATETAWVQSARAVRARGGQILEGVAGVVEDFDYVGFFKSGSVVAEGDYVTDGSSKWDVLHVASSSLLGSTSHKEAYLKLMMEG